MSGNTQNQPYLSEIEGLKKKINEQEHVLSELKEAKQKYESLFQNMINGYAYHKIIINKKGVPIDYQVLDINPAYTKITGLSHEKVTTQSICSVIPGIDKSWIELVGKVAITRKSKSVVQYIKALDRYYQINIFSPEKYFFTTIFADITERINAQKDLENSKLEFEAIFNSMNDAILFANINREIIKINPAFEKLFGYGLDEVKGKKTSIIYADPKDFRTQGKQRYNTKVNTPEAAYEVLYKKKNGEIFISETKGVKVFSSNGEVIGFLGIINDITARKETEKRLKQNQEFNELIVKTSPVGISVVGTDGQIKFANPVAEEILMLNHSKKNQTNYDDPSWEITDFEGNSIPSYKLPFGLVKNTLKPVYGYKHAIKTNSDDIKYLSINASPVINQQGEFDGMVASIEDITKQIHSENLLTDAEQRIQFLINQLPLVFWATDQDLNFISSQGAGLNELGLKPNEVVEMEMNLYQYFDTKDENHEAIKLSKNAIEGESGYFIFEWNNNSFDCHVQPLRDSKNKIIGTLGLAINKTEQIEYQKILKLKNEELVAAEEELRATNEELIDVNQRLEIRMNELQLAKAKAEESDQLKSAFLANMSHEIRTPMNGILGFSNMLDKEGISAEKRKYFTKIIRDSGEQLLSIISDLIDISKIEAGQIELIPDSFSVNEIITSLYHFFRPVAEKKGLELTFKTSLPENHAVLVIDHNRLKQVLTNLLSNALKFTEKGSVEYGYELKNHYLQFYVKDTGIGIQKNKIDIIFERFRQAEINTSQKFGGTGLGLAISKAIIELMDGTIWLESEPGVGTSFYFAIPYITANKINNEKLSFPNESKMWMDKTILIAEDEDFNYMLLEEYLINTNLNIIWVKTGIEAVHAVQNNHIDLILMDLKMPEMDGFEATKQIKDSHPNIPIIAQTAYAMSGDEDKARMAGCDNYISKPIKEEDFQEILALYLHNK